ncbi:MAG: hypothetical protein ACRD0U_19750 [Acidimicrobiales bacterium]
MAGRRTATVLVVAILVVPLAGCQDDTVLIRFQPPVGATYRYRSHVESRAVTALAENSPADVSDSATLTADHEVVTSDAGAVRIRVVLSRPGTGEGTYVMRFDRSAQLTAVESVEGIPAAALGDLGVSEIFPAGASAPPDRRLAPGDRWTIANLVQLPGMAVPASLTGEGRLVELGVVDGRDTATVETTFTLPVTSTGLVAGGSRTLSGSQTTVLRTTHDLVDGAIRRAVASTTGHYSLTLAPAGGAPGEPIAGTLDVEVRSTSDRVG